MRTLRAVTMMLLLIVLWLGQALAVSADGVIIPILPPVPPHPPVWPRPLAIEYHRVTVTIDEQVATTHVDQVFVNESPHDMEGEYLFPLPVGATISRFAMWVDGRPLEAQVLDRDEARRIYEDIVRERRDPALLEYVDRGAFRARIYPIPAWGEKRIEIEYSEVLSADGGLVRYVYPLSTEKFSSRPLDEASVTVHVSADQEIRALYSPSHAISERRVGDREVEAVYRETGVVPSKDFVLYYSVGEGEPSANLMTYRDAGEDGFFLLLLAHPEEGFGSAETRVGMAGCEQAPRHFLIEGEPPGLDVGAEITAHSGAFVKIKPELVQGIDQVLDRPLDESGAVRILDAQDEFSPGAAGEKVVVEGGAQSTDMQITRGAGCETYADVCHVLSFMAWARFGKFFNCV